MTASFPSEARVGIVGGGIIGTSIAYHLTKMGWEDDVLLERKKFTSGTTWHAAGLVGQLRPSQNMTKLAKYTAELYTHKEAKTGQAKGFKQNASMAKVFGLDVDVISTSEVREHYSLINADDVIGGTWIESDGQINPIDATQALARVARSGGARIFEDTKVTRILHDSSRAIGVETDKDITPNLPVFRDYDACAYYKEDAGKILLGAFAPVAKPWGSGGIPESFCFDELLGDFDHFQPVLEKAILRMPVLEHAGIQTFFCGPESFTHDDRNHLGELPEIKNLLIASGFNSIGIQSAGGVGKVLSEWMRDGQAPQDLWEVDVRRNIPFQNNQKYLHDRATEGLGLVDAMHWIKQHAEGTNATISNVTSAYAELRIMVPNARNLINRVSSADSSNEAFPIGTFQESRSRCQSGFY